MQSTAVSSATLYANALLEVGNGGSVTYLKTSGNVSAAYGANLNQITIFNSGNVTVTSGGCLANTTVSSGGSAVISSGANLTSATLRSGAHLMVRGSAYGIESAGATPMTGSLSARAITTVTGKTICSSANTPPACSATTPAATPRSGSKWDAASIWTGQSSRNPVLKCGKHAGGRSTKSSRPRFF